MFGALFPYRCILCTGPAEGRDLCRPCAADLPWEPAGTRVKPLAAFRYQFPVDQMLLKLKFGKRLVVGRVLGDLLAEYLLRANGGLPPNVDAILPVPLHPARMRERGYNQAIEIARPVARRLDIPLLTSACRRIRDTKPQSTLTGAARVGNLAGAFAASDAVVGMNIAIVDDVFTTGSTVEAVEVALTSAGVSDVSVWTVAIATQR